MSEAIDLTPLNHRAGQSGQALSPSVKPAAPLMEPLALGAKDLARMLGISVYTLERWSGSGELGPAGIKKGGRRLWPLAEVRSWVAAGMPRRETWLAVWRPVSIATYSPK